MYAPYFGLKHEPFSIAPDPRYLFMSERHREALAHLLYGLGGRAGAASGAAGGFVLLSGEIGTGKTTVCRLFLEQIPADCNVAYIFNPKLTVIELLQSICDEFHLAAPDRDRPAHTVKDYLDPLNRFLLQAHGAGRNNVLIIDEAQNLSAQVLEQLRLLTNLETSERKLLQIVLIGQPELRALLARPELEQLAQRVVARYHLDALTETETAQYILHRLEVAGLTRPLPFQRKALRRIHRLSGGVPRRINLLCDRALLGAFASGQPQVDRAIVDKAALEVFGKPAMPSLGYRRVGWLGAGLVAGAALFAAVSQLLGAGDGSSLRAESRAGAVLPRKASASSVAIAAVPPVALPATPARASASAAPVLLRDADQAWRELAQAWQLPATDGPPCEAFKREQVHCWSRQLSLPLIRQLARPGILALDKSTGTPSYAVLAALGANSATLRAAGTEQTVTLAALAARWDGDFATLWRTPPGYGSRMADGQGGPTMDWLAARLAALDGRPAPSGRQTLNPALKARLRAFQLAQGLTADGQLGPMTFMQLNRSAGVDEPRLRTEP